MRALRVVEAAVRALGRAVAWLCAALVGCQAVAVCLRYVFGVGAIGLQEAVIYCHALLFLCGAAYVLQLDGHVRVDIVYGRLRGRARRAVDLVGLALFVIPTAAVIGTSSWSYVARAWASLEGSRQAGGLPAIYLLKSAILVFAVALVLQALATIARIVTGTASDAWTGGDPDTPRPETPR
ncbi:MAG: TRAP transporter small permease subunit [Ectothiorhodospiraceae bacterium]|nr:TRAP transporter small permease subunit [Chromatiales bacterium]MCP5154100.1 TRAP transporter small permease subunit [Ectothiorhodospiraceae bacterium]